MKISQSDDEYIDIAQADEDEDIDPHELEDLDADTNSQEYRELLRWAQSVEDFATIVRRKPTELPAALQSFENALPKDKKRHLYYKIQDCAAGRHVRVGTHYGDLIDSKWNAFLEGTASPLGWVQEFEILSSTGGALGRNATLDSKSSEAIAKAITHICEVIPLDLVLLDYETKTLIVQVVLLNAARSDASRHLALKDVTWKQAKTDDKWELSGETSYFNSRSFQAETLMIVVRLRAQTSLSHIPSRLNGTTIPRSSWPRILNTAYKDAQNAGRLINMLQVWILGKCCTQQEVHLSSVYSATNSGPCR